MPEMRHRQSRPVLRPVRPASHRPPAVCPAGSARAVLLPAIARSAVHAPGACLVRSAGARFAVHAPGACLVRSAVRLPRAALASRGIPVLGSALVPRGIPVFGAALASVIVRAPGAAVTLRAVLPSRGIRAAWAALASGPIRVLGSARITVPAGGAARVPAGGPARSAVLALGPASPVVIPGPVCGNSRGPANCDSPGRASVLAFVPVTVVRSALSSGTARVVSLSRADGRAPAAVHAVGCARPAGSPGRAGRAFAAR
jgi:hypothetical protein